MLRAARPAALLVAVALAGVTPVGAQSPAVAPRLVDLLRYTAHGDTAVLQFIEPDPDATAGQVVTLRSRLDVVASGQLGPVQEDGTRVAELRVDDLRAGAHSLKACSPASCAAAVHVVFDGPIDGIAVALFGRRATAAELNRFAGRPLGEVAQELAASDERRHGVVRELYRYYLGRNPEPAGMAFWLANLDDDTSADDMAQVLCGAEPRAEDGRPPGRCWPADVAGTSDAGAPPDEAAREWVVRRTFLALLGREPELGARRHWTAVVTGPATPDALLVGLLGTAEYAEHSGR